MKTSQKTSRVETSDAAMLRWVNTGLWVAATVLLGLLTGPYAHTGTPLTGALALVAIGLAVRYRRSQPPLGEGQLWLIAAGGIVAGTVCAGTGDVMLGSVALASVFACGAFTVVHDAWALGRRPVRDARPLLISGVVLLILSWYSGPHDVYGYLSYVAGGFVTTAVLAALIALIPRRTRRWARDTS